jgi:hypothetical protein
MVRKAVDTDRKAEAEAMVRKAAVRGNPRDQNA